MLHQTPASGACSNPASERGYREKDWCFKGKNVHSEHANSKHGRVPRTGRLCAHLIIIAEEMRVGTKLNENIWGDAEARHQYL